MKLTSKIGLLLFISLTVFFPVAVWAHANGSEAEDIVVRITKTGFQPRNLEIATGDIVHWINDDTKPHWPASDPHPVHDALAGFDPQKALQEGGQWEFKFEKDGTWYYHDHLNPHQTGKIVVASDSSPEAPKNWFVRLFTAIKNWFLKLGPVSKNKQLYSSLADRPEETPPEVKLLLHESDPKKQNKLVRGLLERYSPLAVQELLKDSGLPFTGESHFIVHTVGDWLYERYGTEGLPQCTDYFLSACYHGLILHELGDHGTKRLPEIMALCEKAGFAVTAQCAHGFGHGFLAWLDYGDLIGAFRMCDVFDGKSYAFNCHDGVSMENLVAAFAGGEEEKRWIRKDDPLYPCNAIPEKYRPGCWSNQASLMFREIYAGDLRQVARQCDLLVNERYQEVCYNNFARQVHPMTSGQTDQAVALCGYATGKWQEQCLLIIMQAAFSVGDKETMPYEICQTVSVSSQARCYEQLIGMIASEAGDTASRRAWCGRITHNEFKTRCLANLD